MTMALYTGANFRSGQQAYAHFKAQDAKIITPNTIADPAVQSSINTPIGVMPYPGSDRSEGVRGIESIGAGREVAIVPGRREYGLRARISVADGTFLTHAVRKHAAPATAGTVKGLQLLTFEVGTDTVYSDSFAFQHIDSLINTLRLDYAEGQEVTADVDLWSMVEIPQPTPQTAVMAAADVLIWQHMSVTVGGEDYHNILSRVSVTVNNRLLREGMRQQYAALGATEPAISRAAYYIGPGVEQVQVSYGLRDTLPAALLDSDDWGAVTLRAEQPGTGAGRKFLQVVINHSYISRFGRQQAPAGSLLTYTADTQSRIVAITAGVTKG